MTKYMTCMMIEVKLTLMICWVKHSTYNAYICKTISLIREWTVIIYKLMHIITSRRTLCVVKVLLSIFWGWYSTCLYIYVFEWCPFFKFHSISHSFHFKEKGMKWNANFKMLNSFNIFLSTLMLEFLIKTDIYI